MTGRRTQILSADPAGIARAAELLRAGALVAFPTETVYGLGADARDQRAAQAIFAAKGRPGFNPLIVHVADPDAAWRLAAPNAAALALARAFWPGPLSLVLPLRPEAGIAPAVSAGLPTVALRCPAHPTAQALLRAAGVPTAAPSANRSGAVSPTAAAHVAQELEGRIDAILDGDPCPVGLESAIVGFEDDAPVLLRPGGVPLEALEAALGRPLARARTAGEARAGRPDAPGQLASHYAPRATLRLNAAAPAPGEAWLGFGPDPEGVRGPARNLSPAGDLDEAAANLFAMLRALDRELAGGGTIAVAPVPERGLGMAINDRLRRAAAPRGDVRLAP
ncbi:L-threonylcarbamoyladenylate synthase [Oceanicella actignis]|uniref:L-threonylcarbamoyladenylate synthase n=1 Tax=Oceanicella actignis TaxID=1189325 RepID=UPI0011E6370A|nr:L-threonylcarbamoyladenylate synthase [Oceanicella actignis]TYO90754.1 L-threonylcarbamoyladenylate synthase [Oceanicella actignis]